MGKKLDALLGRTFKVSKFKATVNVAISRLAVLKNQRLARSSVARSDVVQLLKLGHHERALLRVEQVIKEQNMLDVFATIEGYCFLLIERVNLIEQENVCPEELKEAIASLLYASTRCGDFPELQEIRAIFTSRFGKEFVARAIELRNNCGVDLKMIQKLSTRQPGLESRLKVLKEIASENDIVLQIEEASSVTTEEKLNVDQKQNQIKPDPLVNSGGTEVGDNLPVLPEDIKKVETFSDSMKVKKKYKDVADAAQAAFESAAYAAAAARAAVELSRSESSDPDDQNSPKSQSRKVSDTHELMKSKLGTGEEKDSRGIEDLKAGLGFENIHPIQNYHYSESEDKEIHIENKAEGPKQNKSTAEFKRSVSSSSSDSGDRILKRATLSSDVEGSQTKPLGSNIVFDESDDEMGNEHAGISISSNHDLGFHKKQSLLADEVPYSEKSNTVEDEDMFEGSGAKIDHPSQQQFTLRSQAGLKVESGPGSGNPKLHSAEGSRMRGTQNLNAENKPISVRTRRVYGR